MATREASHAGSWYESKGPVLASQLQGWLDKASPLITESPVRAIIAPHAGYSYSGPVAGHAYQYLNSSVIDKIFILGPSHHHYTKKCELSKNEIYSTPLGNLTLDKEIIGELKSSELFDLMDFDVDESEHSIEMHLPYISHRMGNKKFTIIPILVGSLSQENERKFGELLSKYFLLKNCFFIISSDFCHWGQRFRFTHYDSKFGEIHQSIEALDKEGMKIIEEKNSEKFSSYDNKYHNTICGRHPIGVLLNIIQSLKEEDKNNLTVKFINYAQSNAVKRKSESSVSYAAAIVY